MFGTTPSPTIKKKPLNEKINNKIAKDPTNGFYSFVVIQISPTNLIISR